MKYGIYQRTAPRITVLRGYTGNESSGLTLSAKITNGQTIKSGQIISLTNGQWVLGGQLSKCPYIAMADDTDSDVVSSGLLLGLSCSGNFEVQTAYLHVGDTFNQDTALTFDGTTGAITAIAMEIFAAGQKDIIGYCTRAKIDLNIGGPGAGYGTKPGPGNLANGGVDSQSAPVAGNTYVVQWVTRWLPTRENTAAA